MKCIFLFPLQCSFRFFGHQGRSDKLRDLLQLSPIDGDGEPAGELVGFLHESHHLIVSSREERTMSSMIPLDAEEVKLVLNHGGRDRFERRIVKQVVEIALVSLLQPLMGEHGFYHGLREGAEFHQTTGMIRMSVSLRKPAEVGEFFVVLPEKLEVLRIHDTRMPFTFGRKREGIGSVDESWHDLPA